MAFTNSSLVSYVMILPFCNENRYSDFPSCKVPITQATKITIHHYAGVCRNIKDYEAIAKSRQESCQYLIDVYGNIGLFCNEKSRSWCSSSAWNDNRAITIEVSNDKVGEPWSISDASYKALIKLCVDICKRNGIKKLEFTGDKNGSLTYHYMFWATACPGTWIKNHTQEICDKVNAQLNTKPEPTVLYTKTLVSGTPIYKEDSLGKGAISTVSVTTKYSIVGEKVVNYIKYGKLKSGAGWVEVEKLKRTFSINNSSDVKELQNALNKKGFNCGIADGIVGNNTTNAMFQALCEEWLQYK